MTVKSAQLVTGNFVTLDATGALAAASVGPAGTLYVAGVATADAVTISGANPYKFSVTCPALTAGQSVGVYVTATVGGIATAAFVFEDLADTKRVSDLNDAAIAAVADAVCDEVISASYHNVKNSMAVYIRKSGGGTSATIHSGTASAGGLNTITLQNTASTTADIYNRNTITITGGAGVGQTRRIVDYTAARVAYVDKAWSTAVNATSTYDITASVTSIVSDEGVAQGGANSTITLAASASLLNDIYNGSFITIQSGPGAGQTEIVTDYDGGSKVLSIAPVTWAVNPTNASVYAVLPAGEATTDTGSITAPTAGEIADAVLDEAATTHTGVIAVNLDATISSVATELAKVPKSDSTVTWNTTALASINAEADTALSDIHLDHLFAVDYDPATKPGVATALLNEIIGNDAGVSQFTANALELAPVTTAAPAMITGQQVRDAMKLDATVGAPAAGSVDQHLDDLLTNVGALPVPPAMITGQQVRDAMKLDAGIGAPAAGSVDAHLDTIVGFGAPPAMITAQAVRDAMKLAPTALPAPAAGSVDDHLDDMPVDADTQLSLTHGAGAWGGFGLSAQQVRDAMKLDATVGAPAAGSVDQHLDDILTDIGTLPTPPAMITGQQVRDAMKLAPTVGVPAAGSVDDHLDDMPVDTDTQLSGVHGGGAWGGVGLSAQQVRDAMKLAPTVGVPGADSVDEHLDDLLINVAACCTHGAGAIEFIYSLTDSVTGLPIAGADVWVTTDIAGVNVIASGTTDVFGNVTFWLDPGVYQFFRQRPQYTFNNPDQETVV